MFKRIPIYPFLFVCFVILNPLIYNFTQLNPAQALRPSLILVLVTAAGMVGFYAIFKNWHYAGYLTFLLLAFIFIFGHLDNVLQEPLSEKLEYNPGTIQLILLAIWAIFLIIIGLRPTWIRLGGRLRVTPALNLIFVIALTSQALLGAKDFVTEFPNWIEYISGNESLPETGSNITLDCTQRPDIYFIIMDGYGRSDVLKEMYGVDNSPFLKSLERKGFYIADQSKSNFMQTVYSIPSVLNFDYVEAKPKNISGYQYFPELIADNHLLKLLKQCDYRMVAFETGFFFTNYPRSDVYLSEGEVLNEFEGLLLAGTPIDLLIKQLDLKPPERSYEAHRQRVLYTFHELQNLPKLYGPKLVLAHIISPHPPFVFDADGNPIQPSRNYSIGDGDDYRGNRDEYRQGYADQVRFVDKMLEQTVDAILDNSSVAPIIVIQGDHGPGSHLVWKSPEKSCLWERTSIFNAYYLPEGGAKNLYPSISPVNSFRIILNTYFGTHLDLLPSETYFTSALGTGFIDITAERDSKNNCN